MYQCLSYNWLSWLFLQPQINVFLQNTRSRNGTKYLSGMWFVPVFPGMAFVAIQSTETKTKFREKPEQSHPWCVVSGERNFKLGSHTTLSPGLQWVKSSLPSGSVFWVCCTTSGQCCPSDPWLKVNRALSSARCCRLDSHLVLLLSSDTVANISERCCTLSESISFFSFLNRKRNRIRKWRVFWLANG